MVFCVSGVKSTNTTDVVSKIKSKLNANSTNEEVFGYAQNRNLSYWDVPLGSSYALGEIVTSGATKSHSLGSSGASSESTDSSMKSSHGGSTDSASSNSELSSGYPAGSFGFWLRIWEWCLLFCLCFCCCATWSIAVSVSRQQLQRHDAGKARKKDREHRKKLMAEAQANARDLFSGTPQELQQPMYLRPNGPYSSVPAAHPNLV